LSTSLTPGAVINRHLRLLEPLAHGGTGSVWVAEHFRIGSKVAVKFLAAEMLRKDPTLAERLKREAAIPARLGSVHAVQMVEQSVTEDGTPYLVMELLDGIDLGRAVIATGMLSLDEVVQIVTQVAEVLDRAHALGIIHRDIKPDNIFLLDTRSGEVFVKVLDFGIAKQNQDGGLRVSSMTKSGAIIGTPEFMSPEQALSSRDVDHRADLFSLGLVAYFALTAELPYDGGDPSQPFWLRSQSGPTPVTDKREDLPEALDDWFYRALAVQPSKRFQSASQMARALEEIGAGKATRNTGRPPIESVRPDEDDDEEEEEPATRAFDPRRDSDPVSRDREYSSPPSEDGPATVARAVPLQGTAVYDEDAPHQESWDSFDDRALAAPGLASNPDAAPITESGDRWRAPDEAQSDDASPPAPPIQPAQQLTPPEPETEGMQLRALVIVALLIAVAVLFVKLLR
jgi:serine/threonine protein kinase